MPFITINENKMYFEIEGQGFPIVLIHGFSDSLHFWDHITKSLKKYFTVIRMDLRGHGKTPIGEKEINNHLLARDVEELLNKLYVKKCYVIGFSLGGSIAIDIALNNPKIVKSIVLMSTFASPTPYIKEKFKELNKALKKSYKCFFDTIIPYVLPRDVIEDNISKLEKDKLLKAETANTDDLRRILYGASKYDELENVKKIQSKTLLMASREDELVPCENSLKIAERINNSEVILYDYVKHDILIKENIGNVLENILEFLR